MNYLRRSTDNLIILPYFSRHKRCQKDVGTMVVTISTVKKKQVDRVSDCRKYRGGSRTAYKRTSSCKDCASIHFNRSSSWKFSSCSIHSNTLSPKLYYVFRVLGSTFYSVAGNVSPPRKLVAYLDSLGSRVASFTGRGSEGRVHDENTKSYELQHSVLGKSSKLWADAIVRPFISANCCTDTAAKVTWHVRRRENRYSTADPPIQIVLSENKFFWSIRDDRGSRKPSPKKSWSPHKHLQQ